MISQLQPNGIFHILAAAAAVVVAAAAAVVAAAAPAVSPAVLGGVDPPWRRGFQRGFRRRLQRRLRRGFHRNLRRRLRPRLWRRLRRGLHQPRRRGQLPRRRGFPLRRHLWRVLSLRRAWLQTPEPRSAHKAAGAFTLPMGAFDAAPPAEPRRGRHVWYRVSNGVVAALSRNGYG